MKKYLYILLISPIFSLAQVGINTTTPNAQLEIKSSNQATPVNTDGILIPKIDAFPMVDPTAAQKGMLVYLTTASGANQPGFYYWNNPGWIGISSDSSAWKIGGNTGTNPATNFMGTTDAKDLTFRTNNIDKMKLMQNGGLELYGVAADSSAIYIGRKAGLANTAANGIFIGKEAGLNTSGNSNTMIGLRSGKTNTSGYENVFLGYQTGMNNTTGRENTFLGSAAGQANTTGNTNVFIGNAAGFNHSTGQSNIIIGSDAGTSLVSNSQNTLIGSRVGQNLTSGQNVMMGNSAGINTTTGNSNTFIGTSVGSVNTTGSNNVLLGKDADVGANNLTNATALGYQALVNSSNSLVLGSIAGVNLAAQTVNVGIGTTTPADRLHVVGNIRMVDGNQGTGKVLTSDANGTATWQNASANAWGLTGNAGTDSTTNFIGTTDAVDFVAKTSNVERVRIKSTGKVGIGTNNPQYTLDLAQGTFGFGNGNSRSEIRSDAGLFGISAQSGFFETSSPINFPTGATSWWHLIDTRHSNSANNYALQIAGSFFDQDLWFRKTNNSATTPWSKILTTMTGWGIDGNSGTNPANNFIGTTDAIDFVAKTSNVERVRIKSSGEVGIGTTTPTERLHIVGKIRMVDGNQAAGKVLTSDVNGIATWQNASFWGLTGNGGTNSATNFIGTTDAVDFVAKTSNVERVRIKNSGEVGIGTSSPADRLHVVGNIRMVDGNQAAGKVLTSDANGTATWQNVSANAWGLSGNTGTSAATNYLGTTDDVDVILRRFNIRAGRIGTNNTSLGVNALNTTATGTSNTAIGVDALKSATTGTNNTAIGQNALGIINSGTYNTAIGSEASTSSTLLTNATAIGSRAVAGANNVMVLGSINGVNGATSSVNVGIGTTTPSARLEIVDENAVTAAITRGNLHVMTNNPQALDIGGAITLGGYSDDAASATRVFASVEGRKSTATSGTSSGYLQFKTNNAGTLIERVRITNTGNVGVGTATPGGQFELSLDQGRKPGTTTWTVTSDERLKDISGDYTFGLEAIKQLKPIRYHYKNIGDRSFDPKILATEFSGFSAQEVQKVFPNCVTTDEDGYLSLNIHDIVIASINAIKELDKKNAELQLENEALKRKLQQHDEQLAAILAELQKRQ